MQLGLGLGLGTGNGYFMPMFFPIKVTNTFVLPSWAEAWCKCDVMRFIRDCLHGSLPRSTDSLCRDGADMHIYAILKPEQLVQTELTLTQNQGRYQISARHTKIWCM